MRPLMLQGHERSITQIKYSREGDLLFSSSKDNRPNVWFSINGERLGTYNGHQGAVWCIDVDWTTTKFMSGGGDMNLKLWDVEIGKALANIEAKSSVRSCNFSYSGNQAAYSTDKAMNQVSELYIIDVRTVDSSLTNALPNVSIPMPESKITSMFWFMDEMIITGHENGQIAQWDTRMGKKLNSSKEHLSQIQDMQLNREMTMFVTASKDATSKLFDVDTLDCLKTYKTERPVNSAAISPIYDHVVLGGGQEAMDVTTTSTRSGKFDSRFFHLVYEEEFARLKGHFGPINSLAFHPDGKSFASGGEDGFVRIQTFDQSYHELVFE